MRSSRALTLALTLLGASAPLLENGQAAKQPSAQNRKANPSGQKFLEPIVLSSEDQAQLKTFLEKKDWLKIYKLIANKRGRERRHLFYWLQKEENYWILPFFSTEDWYCGADTAPVPTSLRYGRTQQWSTAWLWVLHNICVTLQDPEISPKDKQDLESCLGILPDIFLTWMHTPDPSLWKKGKFYDKQEWDSKQEWLKRVNNAIKNGKLEFSADILPKSVLWDMMQHVLTPSLKKHAESFSKLQGDKKDRIDVMNASLMSNAVDEIALESKKHPVSERKQRSIILRHVLDSLWPKFRSAHDEESEGRKQHEREARAIVEKICNTIQRGLKHTDVSTTWLAQPHFTSTRDPKTLRELKFDTQTFLKHASDLNEAQNLLKLLNGQAGAENTEIAKKNDLLKAYEKEGDSVLKNIIEKLERYAESEKTALSKKYANGVPTTKSFVRFLQSTLSEQVLEIMEKPSVLAFEKDPTSFTTYLAKLSERKTTGLEKHGDELFLYMTGWLHFQSESLIKCAQELQAKIGKTASPQG